MLSSDAADVNVQDQWGFSPLHYATFHRQKKIIQLLLSHGAICNIKSKSGTTPLDIAITKKYDEIIDILHSKSSLEKDDNYPSFREWLYSLGAGEYLSAFIEGGYDLAFISKEGLNDEDLNCIGIPESRLGLRKKLKKLYRLDEFYKPEEEEEDDDDDEEEEDDEEDDESSEKDNDEEEEEEEEEEDDDEEDDD